MPLPSLVQLANTFGQWVTATNNLISHVDNTSVYILVSQNATPRVSTGNVSINGTATIATVNITSALTANSSNGTSGEILTSNGAGAYWAPAPVSVNTTGGTGSIQFYNGTTIGSSANLVFNGTNIFVGNSTSNGNYGQTTLAVSNTTSTTTITPVGLTLGTTVVNTSTTVLGGTLSVTANANFDAGTLFVDAVNNRVGINNTTPTYALVVNGTTSVKSVSEAITISAINANGTINFDSATQGVLLYTSSAAANWTLNLRGNSTVALSSVMATGDSMTVTFLVTQGATAYYASAHQIDGSSVSPKWQDGAVPFAGNPSAIDAYTYTVIKTAATPTWTVLASRTKYA